MIRKLMINLALKNLFFLGDSYSITDYVRLDLISIYQTASTKEMKHSFKLHSLNIDLIHCIVDLLGVKERDPYISRRPKGYFKQSWQELDHLLQNINECKLDFGDYRIIFSKLLLDTYF